MSHTWVHVRVHMYINHSYRYICTHVCDVTYVIHTHSCVWRNDELRHTHECICECICTLTTHIDTYVLMCVTHMHSCVWRHICTHMCIYVAHMTSHTWVHMCTMYVHKCYVHICTHVCDVIYALMCVTKLICMRDVTHLHVWRDSCVWHICTHVCDVTICMCDVIHLHEWRDSFTSLIFMCDVHMHSCVWRNASVCVTWLIYICDVMQTWLIYLSGSWHR